MGGRGIAVAVAFVVVASIVSASGPGLSQNREVQGESIVVYSPAGIYFAGQEIEVRGRAQTGIDRVALYVRDQGAWELVDLNEDGRLDDADAIPVDDDGDWQRGGVTLSNASRILTLPGVYRVGVVDVVDATADDGTLRTTLSVDRFISATGTQDVIEVRQPILEGAFLSIRDEVATDDGVVGVQGIARGMTDVLVVVVDRRGRIVTQQVTTSGRYDIFDEDIPLRTDDGRPLSEGQTAAVVVALGRDRVAGDGTLPGQPGATLSDLEAYVDGLGSGLSQQQVLDMLYGETTSEGGSDDLTIFRSFGYTDGRTSVRDVVPERFADARGIHTIEVGETMLVRGTTNRKPEDNTIRVEAVEGPSAQRLAVVGTDQWDSDGVWSVRIPVEDVEPGSYVLRIDVGRQTTDRVRIEIVPPGERRSMDAPETTSTPEPTPMLTEPAPGTTAETPTTTTETPTTTMGTPEDETTETPTG